MCTGKEWEWEYIFCKNGNGNGNGMEIMGMGGNGNGKTHSRTPLVRSSHVVECECELCHILSYKPAYVAVDERPAVDDH